MGAMGGSLCCNQNTGLREDLHSKGFEAEKGPISDKDALCGDVGDDAQDQAKVDKMKGAQRRGGVAAESMAPVDFRDYKKPVYAKDEAAKERIREVLRSDQKMQVLLGHLDKAGLNDIVNAFKERQARQGEALIRQGDEGDCLYIIDDGKVDIFVARPGSDGAIVKGHKGDKVVTFGPGAMFGELALLYASPRAATAIVATASCSLWQLDRDPFKMLLAQKSQMRQELYEGWLASVDILKPLNRYELSKLSDLLVSELYDVGEVIVKQGDPGDKFYILEEGTCNAFLEGGDGEKLVMEYKEQGQYFGEIALLKNEPRLSLIHI